MHITCGQSTSTNTRPSSGSNLVRSLFFWGYLSISSVFLFAIALAIWLVTTPFDRQRRLLHKFTCWWAYHYMALFPFWRLRVENLHFVDEQSPSILLANHQSMGDILVLFGLRKHFKWVAKQSLFRIPFIGWNMRLNGYVSLNRTGLKSIKQMMHKCQELLTDGSSILLFPEGTRSLDGNLRSFKLGAFQLACNARVPVTPIVLNGTFEALPKSGWIFRNKTPVTMEMKVLSPIDPSVVDFNPTRLSSLVHDTMANELCRLRTRERSNFNGA